MYTPVIKKKTKFGCINKTFPKIAFSCIQIECFIIFIISYHKNKNTQKIIKSDKYEEKQDTIFFLNIWTRLTVA